MSQKFEYKTNYTIGNLENHHQIKSNLLKYFDEIENNTEHEYGDLIHKLDWNDNKNFDRPWVRYFMQYFSKYLTKESAQKNMQEWKIEALWFQQYENSGHHGWHTHSANYTGVYYVELPEDSPITEMKTEDNVTFSPEAKEGDILIFPSYIAHRAPVNKSSDRKTIISFNLNMFYPEV